MTARHAANKNRVLGTSQTVQWFRLCATTAGGLGSIPGQGTKILDAAQCSQRQNKTNNKKIIFQKKYLMALPDDEDFI